MPTIAAAAACSWLVLPERSEHSACRILQTFVKLAGHQGFQVSVARAASKF